MEALDRDRFIDSIIWFLDLDGKYQSLRSQDGEPTDWLDVEMMLHATNTDTAAESVLAYIASMIGDRKSKIDDYFDQLELQNNKIKWRVPII